MLRQRSSQLQKHKAARISRRIAVDQKVQKQFRMRLLRIFGKEQKPVPFQ